MSKKRDILNHYEWRIDPACESYEVLDWASAASQHARFEVLADSVELAGRRLLDVGCGLGDLWAFLKRRGVEVEYVGVDLLEKMVEAARRRQPDATFVHADLFDPAAPCPFAAQSFDVIFCSGIFNLNLGNNLAFLVSAVRRLMAMSRREVVFNLLHARAEMEAHRYAYYRPDEVLPAIEPLGWDLRVLDEYLPNDFTVICTRRSDGH